MYINCISIGGRFVIQKVSAEIQRILTQFFKDQTSDGSWDYPFEMGIVTDCYMIILLRTLEMKDESLIHGLASRIASKQEANGAWKLYQDEKNGNLSTTIEAYFALLFSGYKNKQDNEMKATKQFILENGGLSKAKIFTKIMLVVTGQYKWPDLSPIPIEFMLLPESFPINFFNLSVFARANLAPAFILADSKFTMKTTQTPDLSDLHVSRERAFFSEEEVKEWRSILDDIEKGIETLIGLPEELHNMALARTEQYIQERIESNGTLESYFSATYLMIFAFISLGYRKDHPIILKAINGLKSTICSIENKLHVQYTTANVWNTALISYAVQEAGVHSSNQMVEKANQYLISRQQQKFGDWALHNPNVPPGGWGFSDINTINPDVDDSTAALRAIARRGDELLSSWNKGIQWVMSMQNDDGGWPAFEKDVDNPLLTLFPIDHVEDLVLDASSPDLTGRTLEFLGNYTNIDKNHPMIQEAVKWLLDKQNPDGSWDARWGIYYIYGTWAAVIGLTAVGVPARHPAIQKATSWLRKTQQSDGGWGESCKSDKERKYVPLQVSTRTHTAWALDALIAATKEVTPEIKRGLEFLVGHKEEAWTWDYPKGRGMAGAFYIHYHCYDYVWPLLTLAHYRNKFS